jgi:L-fuconate dehydratase
MIDYLCFAPRKEDRVCEYVDHLHDHILHPPMVRNGAYFPPLEPGFSIEMKATSLAAFSANEISSAA